MYQGRSETTGSLSRWPAMAASLSMVALLATGCLEERRERIEEEAAPGMEADAAAPESGPVDGFEVQPPVPAPDDDTVVVDQTLPPVAPPDTMPDGL